MLILEDALINLLPWQIFLGGRVRIQQIKRRYLIRYVFLRVIVLFEIQFRFVSFGCIDAAEGQAPHLELVFVLAGDLLENVGPDCFNNLFGFKRIKCGSVKGQF